MEFNKEAKALADNNLHLRLTNEKLFETYGSLSQGMTNFLSLSEKQRTSTAVLASEFSFLGVSAGDTSKILDSMSYAFGLNVESSLAAADGLRDIALETGRSLPSVTQELSGMTSQLARFGKRGPQVFRRLAIQARQLGLTIKDAFDLSEQFDTFEGAANVAGRLNAQLGMQLNSVEIMSASSEDRLELLREEFKLQGLNFQGMGRRQKQMVAEIVAGGDVEKAARLFGGKVEVKKKATREDINAKNLATMAEIAKSAADRATRDLSFNKTVQQAGIDAADTLGRWQPAIFTAISFMGLAQTAMSFKTMRNTTKLANTRASASSNIAGGAPGGPKPKGWNQFRSANKGKGWTPKQMSQNYQAQRVAAPTPTAGGSGWGSTAAQAGKGALRSVGGVATGVLTAGFSAHEEYKQSKSAARAATRGILGGGGAMAGMAAGAAIGSIIPGAGTIVGGLAGLILGSAGAWLGGMAGNKAADAVLGSPKGKDIKKEALKATQAALEQKKTQAKSLESMDRLAQTRAKQPIQMQGTVVLEGEPMGTFVTNAVDNRLNPV